MAAANSHRAGQVATGKRRRREVLEGDVNGAVGAECANTRATQLAVNVLEQISSATKSVITWPSSPMTERSSPTWICLLQIISENSPTVFLNRAPTRKTVPAGMRELVSPARGARELEDDVAILVLAWVLHEVPVFVDATLAGGGLCRGDRQQVALARRLALRCAANAPFDEVDLRDILSTCRRAEHIRREGLLVLIHPEVGAHIEPTREWRR